MTRAKSNISIIFQENLNNIVYVLCQIDILEYRKYAIYITNEVNSDFEFIDDDKNSSEAFFFKAVEYGLSPLHLKDAISDYLSNYKEV